MPVAVDEPSLDDLSVERLRELMSELDREMQARADAKKSKSELQVKFGRLCEAIKKKRDECARERDEAVREKEELLQWKEKVSAELADATGSKAEALSQKDQMVRQLEEAVESKDKLRSEIETSALLLASDIGKISAISNFSAWQEDCQGRRSTRDWLRLRLELLRELMRSMWRRSLETKQEDIWSRGTMRLQLRFHSSKRLSVG